MTIKLMATIMIAFILVFSNVHKIYAEDKTVILLVEGNTENKNMRLVRNFFLEEFKFVDSLTIISDSIRDGVGCVTETELKSFSETLKSEFIISVCVRHTATEYFSCTRLYSTNQGKIINTGTTYTDTDIMHLSTATVPFMVKEIQHVLFKSPVYHQQSNHWEPQPVELSNAESLAPKKDTITLPHTSSSADQSTDTQNLINKLKEAKNPADKIQFLTRLGDAYLTQQNYKAAKKNYEKAISIYKKQKNISQKNITSSIFKIGEIYHHSFTDITLTASSKKEISILITKKIKALSNQTSYYTRVIKIGNEEWTARARYLIGMGFVEMADAVNNQTLFGNATQKIATKIRILSSLKKYYKEAQDYFQKNIRWAIDRHVKNEYTDQSIIRYAEVWYRQGFIMEQVGVEFSNAPVPKGLSKEESRAYKELLNEKRLEATEAALPIYEEGLKATQKLQFKHNKWIDSIRVRIEEINPKSSAVSIHFNPGDSIDTDMDNIKDPMDKCPQEAEDKDNFLDDDGCPDLDNDNDGIVDAKDSCPLIAEDLDGFEDSDGCPDLDNDGDGVADVEDKCPNVHGRPDNDGCPKTKEISRGKLVLSGVSFQTGNSKLTPGSYAILDQIYESLAEWPEVRLEIQGHTDNTSNNMANLKLSQLRADAVRLYLINRGISSARLRAVGYGEEFPLEDNNTVKGREKNRRVELRRID